METAVADSAEPSTIRVDDGSLLALERVSKRFVRSQDLAEKIWNLLGARRKEEVVQAVDRVSLAIRRGEVLALVGESGCGKSTLGRLAVGLLAPSHGERYWKNAPLSGLGAAKAREMQLRMQMIFQDPYASLNPRMRVVDIVGEAPLVHGMIVKRQQVEYVGLQLNRVGLDPTLMRRFPHQFSGGQRARIGIARALSVKPEFLVCDESVAALDVSIQAQVLNLLADLQRDLGLAYLFISHDLAVVRHIAHEVLVMYLGHAVEQGPKDKIFAQPLHPYTQALLASTPGLVGADGQRRERIVLQGELPSPLSPPPGCVFSTRCAYATERCRAERPLQRPVDERLVACHYAEDFLAPATRLASPGVLPTPVA